MGELVETIGSRIKKRRLALGLSQRGLALSLGLTANTAVYLWERDKNRPNPSNMAKIAEKLHTTAEYLTFGEASSHPERSPPASIPSAASAFTLGPDKPLQAKLFPPLITAISELIPHLTSSQLITILDLIQELVTLNKK